MSATASSEKTEKATPKRREDQRKKGNIFKSKDVVSAFSLLGAALFLRIVAPYLYGYLTATAKGYFTSFSSVPPLTVATARSLMGEFAVRTILVAVPIAFFSVVMGILLTGIQTRFLTLTTMLKPKFSRINPLSGIKKMFSKDLIFELLKSILKIALVAWIVATQVSADLPAVMKMAGNDLSSSFAWICELMYGIALKAGIALAALGAADYFYQWRQYEGQIRMTKQEIKDEYKQMEGDPKIKSRVRDIQRKMAQMRMMQKIPTADAVIKNPTHYAVAISYDSKKNRAPRVVAKGKDHLALRIIEIAEENGVYVTENKPLARGLYESVELEREIPEEFYQAVADVLAFVYNLRKKGKRQ